MLGSVTGFGYASLVMACHTVLPSYNILLLLYSSISTTTTTNTTPHYVAWQPMAAPPKPQLRPGPHSPPKLSTKKSLNI